VDEELSRLVAGVREAAQGGPSPCPSLTSWCRCASRPRLFCFILGLDLTLHWTYEHCILDSKVHPRVYSRGYWDTEVSLLSLCFIHQLLACYAGRNPFSCFLPNPPLVHLRSTRECASAAPEDCHTEGPLLLCFSTHRPPDLAPTLLNPTAPCANGTHP